MKNSPYLKFDCSDLILRDELAVDRTLLSNERTLLAYLRSAAALLIAGFSMIHFAGQDWFWAVGIACLPAGIIVAIVGVERYRGMKESIALVRRQSEMETNKAEKDNF